MQLDPGLSNGAVMNPAKEDKEWREFTNIGVVLIKLTNQRVGKLTVLVDWCRSGHENILSNSLFLLKIRIFKNLACKLYMKQIEFYHANLRKAASRMCVHLFWRTSQIQIEEIPHENNGILGSLFYQNMGSKTEKRHGPRYILTGSAYRSVAASCDSTLNQPGWRLNRTEHKLGIQYP